MRFIYATDLHGNRNAIEQMLTLATQEQVDAVVFGGDLTPKLTAIQLAEYPDPDNDEEMIGGEILPTDQIRKGDVSYLKSLQKLDRLNRKNDKRALVVKLERNGYIIQKLDNAYYAFDMFLSEQSVLEKLYAFFENPKQLHLDLNEEELGIVEDGVVDWFKKLEAIWGQREKSQFLGRLTEALAKTCDLPYSFESLAPSLFLVECIVAELGREKLNSILEEPEKILRKYEKLPLGQRLLKKWKKVQERIMFASLYRSYIEPMMVSGVTDFSTIAELKRNAENIEFIRQGQESFLRYYFIPRVTEWRSANDQKPVYAMLGNDDVKENTEILLQSMEAGTIACLNSDFPTTLKTFPFVGYGYVATLPPQTEYQAWLVSEAEVSRNLNWLRELVGTNEVIWSIHNPPYDCLDQFSETGHAGSHAVRQFVEEAQPQIALFGHIHEAARIAGSCVARIGKTLCINPGAEHSDGVQAVIVNTDSIEVEKVFKGEKVCQ